MPELPEVETVMRGLQARLEGRRIIRASVHRPDLRWALPPGLVSRLVGARVEGFRRRAKYILMRLSGGDSVLLHLGMSGRMVLGPARLGTLHEHMVLETDDGGRVGFVEPRRFGSIDLIPTGEEDAHRLLQGLGPEPLGPAFNTRSLAAAVAGKRTRSRPPCWTSAWLPAWVTSTSAKRCSAPAWPPTASPARSRARGRRAW